VIVEYLDETFPVPPLMPTAPFDRAVARLLVDFANSRLFAATHRLIFERDDTQRRVLVEQMKSDVRFLEETWHGRKRGGPYILGSQFTLADIALYPWFEQLATLQKLSAFRLPSDCRNVRDWSAAVAARPAVKKCSQTEGWYEAGYRDYLAA
jgi:glutathione S-transferase